MNFDPFKFTAGISNQTLRFRVLDKLLNFGIPFNRWLGFKILELSKDRVRIESPPRTLRKNHVGTAHACALTLLGEYPAGLLLIQRFPFEEYRPIITELSIKYLKKGRGVLFSEALAPESLPEFENGEIQVPMESKITDSNGDSVAICTTHWQIKKWDHVRSR